VQDALARTGRMARPRHLAARNAHVRQPASLGRRAEGLDQQSSDEPPRGPSPVRFIQAPELRSAAPGGSAQYPRVSCRPAGDVSSCRDRGLTSPVLLSAREGSLGAGIGCDDARVKMARLLVRQRVSRVQSGCVYGAGMHYLLPRARGVLRVRPSISSYPRALTGTSSLPRFSFELLLRHAAMVQHAPGHVPLRHRGCRASLGSCHLVLPRSKPGGW